MSNFWEQYKELAKVHRKAEDDLNDLIKQNKEEYFSKVAKKQMEYEDLESTRDIVSKSIHLTAYEYYTEDKNIKEIVPSLQLFMEMIDFLSSEWW